MVRYAKILYFQRNRTTHRDRGTLSTVANDPRHIPDVSHDDSPRGIHEVPAEALAGDLVRRVDGRWIVLTPGRAVCSTTCHGCSRTISEGEPVYWPHGLDQRHAACGRAGFFDFDAASDALRELPS